MSGAARSLTSQPGYLGFARALRTARAADGAPFLDLDRPYRVARAPGRLDLLGGIADYSGALVLELPLAEATWVALQRVPGTRLELFSLGTDAGARTQRYAVELAELADLDEAAARARFAAEPADSAWAAYTAGVFVTLARQAGVALLDARVGGLRALIVSDVPEGKGVSSSAAVEVAVARAAAAEFEVELSPPQLALLCQRVENRIAGAPCGVMDQMTASCGRRDQLLALRCQPAELEGHVPLPPDLAVFGIDSGERHAVSGSDYTAVRVGAFMGRALLLQAGALSDDDYLVQLGVERFAELAADLPVHLDGDAFLAACGGHGDAVTRVDPGRRYAVRQPTAHPIGEHARCEAFVRGLRASAVDPEALGRLLYEGHASMAACGLGSTGTDELVARVRRAGPRAGLFGARVSGGGCGGTVAVLARADAGAAVADLAAAYAADAGLGGRVFAGSSDGAWAVPAAVSGPAAP